MTVLITGAAGFIGSFLTRELISKGIDVVGIDNFHEYYSRSAKDFNLDLIKILIGEAPKSDKEDAIRIFEQLQSYNNQSTKSLGRFKFHEGDVRDDEFITELFEKYSISKIVHLAAMAGVPYSIKKPKLYTDVNINGTVNLLDQAVKNKIQNFVFASSSSVYGATKEVPFIETQNVDNPISPYAATKRMGEIMAYTYNYLHKLPISCLRFFTVYGPLQRPYGMAIQKFIRLVDHDKPMTVYGDGEMARDFTYIDDIVSGIIRVLEADNRYEIFNLGNTNPVTVNALAKLIIKHMGKGRSIHVDKPKTEVPITYADISKARKKLGYKPKISIEEGLKRQIEIYKMMPKWYKELKI